MKLLIVGPPGSGKGTQATIISAKFGIPHISTGEILRDNMRRKTALGVQIQSIMDSGNFVSDEIVNEMIIARLNKNDAQTGFLLDGYPRTITQVHFFNAVLADKAQRMDAVINLVLDQETAIQRALGRAQQQGRVDDTYEVIQHRQEVYKNLTQPIIEYYEQKGLLLNVNGSNPIEEVSTEIFSKVLK